jgi:MSHA biogenesis protein MshK
MADRLMSVFRVTLLLALYTLMPVVQAQTALTDPTRPPPGFTSPAADAGPLAGPVLQSVKIPKKGKPVAIIGGQQVRLGELYGDSRLIRLTEREALLQGPAGTERLMLTPGIEKTNINTKSPVAKRAQSGGKP